MLGVPGTSVPDLVAPVCNVDHVLATIHGEWIYRAFFSFIFFFFFSLLDEKRKNIQTITLS